MKNLISLALVLPLVGCALAEPLTAQPVPGPAVPMVATQVVFTPQQLDTLLGPIALYPDALIALILPASTNPSDVVLAARYLRAGGEPNEVDSQPWDESVQALAHYPQIVTWMDENLAWTTQLGNAFTGQSADVMNAVQRLRAQARAAGTLVDTSQQRVIYEGSTIEIVPAQPDVIYVPYYDPTIVYAPPPSYYGYGPSAFFNFSSGFAAGWWLSFGVDWHDRCLWNVRHEDRERFWREHRNDPHRHVGPPPHDFRPTAPVVRTWRPHPDFHGPRAYPPMRPLPVPSSGRPAWRDNDHDSRPGGWRNDNRTHDRAPGGNVPPPAAAAATAPLVGPQAPQGPRNSLPRVAPLSQAPTGSRPYADWHNSRGRDQTPTPPSSRPPMTSAPQPNPPARAFAPPYGSVGMPMRPTRVAPPPQPTVAPPPPRQAAPPSAPPPQQQQQQQNQQPPPGDDWHRNAREH